MENTFLVPDHDLVTDHEPVVVKIEGSPIVSPIGKREKIKRFGKRMGTKVVALGKGIFHYTQKPAFKRGFRLSCYVGGAGTLFYIFKPILSVNAVDLPGSNQFGPPGKRSNSEYLKTWVSPTAWRAYLGGYKTPEYIGFIAKVKGNIVPFSIGIATGTAIGGLACFGIATIKFLPLLQRQHNEELLDFFEGYADCTNQLSKNVFHLYKTTKTLTEHNLVPPGKEEEVFDYFKKLPIIFPMIEPNFWGPFVYKD